MGVLTFTGGSRKTMDQGGFPSPLAFFIGHCRRWLVVAHGTQRCRVFDLSGFDWTTSEFSVIFVFSFKFYKTQIFIVVCGGSSGVS